MLPLLLFACAGVHGDSAHDSRGGDTADADADADADTDTDTDTDTPTAASLGLLSTAGTATVADRYDGGEELRFEETGGDPATLCLVRLELASTGSRTDCAECSWAFSLVVTAASTEIDEECAAVDLEDPSVFVGTTRAYGFVPDYFGHAPALLMEVDGEWVSGGYAEWDEGTGAFLYERLDGYFDY